MKRLEPLVSVPTRVSTQWGRFQHAEALTATTASQDTLHLAVSKLVLE